MTILMIKKYNILSGSHISFSWFSWREENRRNQRKTLEAKQEKTNSTTQFNTTILKAQVKI